MLKRCLKSLLGLGVAGAALGFVLIWAGAAPISASAGHWAVTSWVLHFAMRQSVQARALFIETPPLQDRARIQRGAGHYVRGCAVCHGAPGERRPVTVRHMTPEPPYLPPRIEHWQPRELFWTVKHGVKFTGMPAWPAQRRDDEVWDVVAFLLRLPDLSPQQYRALAYGDVNDPATGSGDAQTALASLDDPLRDLVEDCARCHGVEGLGRAPGAFPRLRHQRERYLYESLRAYADGVRFSGIMQPVAAALSDDTLRALARYYADPVAATAPYLNDVDPEAYRRGEQIAERGIPKRGVASCVDCHGPAPWPRNAAYPLLAGQDPVYIEAQLQLFKQGNRGGTGHAHIMDISVNQLSQQQMRDVAIWYAAQPPEPPPSSQAR